MAVKGDVFLPREPLLAGLAARAILEGQLSGELQVKEGSPIWGTELSCTPSLGHTGVH